MVDTVDQLENTETAPLAEMNYGETEIRAFSGQLVDNLIPLMEGKPTQEIFTDPSQTSLAEGVVPSFIKGFNETAENSRGFIPKEPLYAALWTLTGVRLSEPKLALDRYTGYPDEIKDIHPLRGEITINVSQEDMADVGRTLGGLFANHALAGRSLTELKPQLGDLGDKRSALLLESKDRLRLLDTILSEVVSKLTPKELPQKT